MQQLLEDLSLWITKFNGPCAILMIGNSASGKSTLAEALAKKLRIATVSSDKIRIAMSSTGSILDQSVNPLVWPQVHFRLKEALGGQESVIADVTNARLLGREAMIAMLRPFAGSVLGIEMDTPLLNCLQRNQARSEPLPEYALARMDLSLIVNPPLLAEGFDGLWRVGCEDYKLD